MRSGDCWLSFSTQPRWRVTGQKAATVRERAALMSDQARTDQADKHHRSKNDEGTWTSSLPMMRSDQCPCENRDGHATPAVPTERFSVVLVGVPGQKPATDNRGRGAEAQAPGQDTAFRKDRPVSLQETGSLDHGKRGEQTNGQVQQNEVKATNKRDPLSRSIVGKAHSERWPNAG
jgi:hypothetical protein